MHVKKEKRKKKNEKVRDQIDTIKILEIKLKYGIKDREQIRGLLLH